MAYRRPSEQCHVRSALTHPSIPLPKHPVTRHSTQVHTHPFHLHSLKHRLSLFPSQPGSPLPRAPSDLSLLPEYRYAPSLLMAKEHTDSVWLVSVWLSSGGPPEGLMAQRRMEESPNRSRGGRTGQQQ